ncbi:hypothetical protein Ciccas_006767, partial [Cichlidogyrus casuarinus]
VMQQQQQTTSETAEQLFSGGTAGALSMDSDLATYKNFLGGGSSEDPVTTTLSKMACSLRQDPSLYFAAALNRLTDNVAGTRHSADNKEQRSVPAVAVAAASGGP